MDGRHPYMVALKEKKKKKEPVTDEKAAAMAAKKEFFDRLSKPTVRTVKPTRTVKPPAATSNRSDQSKRFEGNPNKSEATPSAQNRYGYKKPVLSPRITKTKITPKETSGDKNVVSTPVLQQKEESVSQNRRLSRAPRTSSSDRHEANTFGSGRKQSTESKTRIPLAPQRSVRSNKLKESLSQPGKDCPKSTIPEGKQTKSSSETKTNSGSVDTKSNLPNTIKNKNSLPSPKRLSQSKDNSSTKMNQNKSSKTEEEEEIAPGESVCDGDQYFSNDYQARDTSSLDLECYSLDRVEEKMISYRTKLNNTPSRFAENKDFIKPIQLNATHKAIENETLKATPNSTENIFPNVTNCQKGLETDYQKQIHSDLIRTNEDKIEKSIYEPKHNKQYPTQDGHNSSKELKDYNQTQDSVLRVKRSKGKVADIGNDTHWNASDFNVNVEQKTIPLNSHNFLTADRVPKTNSTNEDNCEESRVINIKQTPDDNGIFDQNVSNSKLTDQSNETILNDERTFDSISSKDNTNRQNRLTNDSLNSLENVEGDQQEHSDKTSPKSPKEKIKPFKHFRKKLRSVFSKSSDSEDSSYEIDAIHDTATGNVSDHSDQETSADQQEHSDKTFPESPNENIKPFKNFEKEVHSVLSKASDREDISNVIDATPDTKTGNVSDHSDQKTSTDQQENSDKTSPDGPKENINPFKIFQKKVRSVFTKDSDSEDNSKEIDVTHNTETGNVSDHSNQETSTDQQENSDKTSPESPKENIKPFKNFQKKVRSVFTKASDSEDSSNEIGVTTDAATGNVSDHSDQETSADQQEHSDKTSPESPKENIKPFKNFRKKFRSVFTKDSDSEDNSNEIDGTPDTTTGETSEINGKSSDKDKTLDTGIFDRHLIDPDKSITIDAVNDAQSQNDVLHPVDRDALESNNDDIVCGVAKGKSDKKIKDSTFGIRNGKTGEATENVQPSSKVALVDTTIPVDQYIVDTAEVQKCSTLYAKPAIKERNDDNIVEPSTEQYPNNYFDSETNIVSSTNSKDEHSKKISENEEFQSEPSSLDPSSNSENSKPEPRRHNKYGNDSIIDLLEKLNGDEENASQEQSPNSTSNLNSSQDVSETEPPQKSPPPRSSSLSRFRTKFSQIFSFKHNRKKSNTKEESFENEKSSDIHNEDENDADENAVCKKDDDDSGGVFGNAEACISDGDNTTTRKDVLKPVKGITTDTPDINDSKKMERQQSDNILSEESIDDHSNLPKEEERFNDHENNDYNPFDKYYYPNNGGNLNKHNSVDLTPTNSYFNNPDSNGIQGNEEDGYSSDGKKISSSNEDWHSTPSTDYKTPPPDIPSINIQKDNRVHQKPNIYYESDDNESLFESSSFYTSSQLSESEFPPEEKDIIETTTPPISSEFDKEENEAKTSSQWYSKFKALFGTKKSEKTPDPITTDDGKFSRSESYHPKMLDTDVVDPDTVSNSPNWSDIIDDDVVSEDVERKLVMQKPISTFNDDESAYLYPENDSVVRTKPNQGTFKSNMTENVSRSASFSDTENHTTLSKLPVKCQSLDQGNRLKDRNSLKRWPPLDENINVATSPVSMQEYPVSSEASTSDKDLSDDSLEDEQKVRNNIDENSLTRPDTPKAETFYDTIDIPQTFVASKNPSKVPVRIKRASFSGYRKPVLSPAQSRLFSMDDPNNQDTVKDSSGSRQMGKDNIDRTSTMSMDESNTVIKQQTIDSDFVEPVTLKANNVQLVRRNDMPQTETRDRNDFKNPMESKYQTINDQVADGHHNLPDGRNITKTISNADSLDENLLTRIFSFLDQKTLTFTLPLVCKKWKRASCHPSLWQYVFFSYSRMSTKFLEKLSQRFTNLRELYFENIQGRPKHRGESEKFYQQEIQGSLEKGLECILVNAEGTLRKLAIINCGPIFTERSLWLVSCYARLLEEFRYHSALHPPSAEVLWALVTGCRDITKLDLSPVNPRSPQQERFNNKCVNLITKGYPCLKSLSIGGCGIDNQGLCTIAQRCQNLEEFELHRFMAEFSESSAKKLCKLGLQNLERLKFIHTPVHSEIIQVFMKYCPNLKKIKVQIEMQDYFSNSEDSKFKQQYRYIIIKLKGQQAKAKTVLSLTTAKNPEIFRIVSLACWPENNSLKTYPKLENVLEFDIQDNK